MALVATGAASCARAPSGDCRSFERTTIADMRRAGQSGCFEIVDAIVEGRTASPTAPRVFATDSAAGPWTAIMGKCSADSEPHCSSAAASTTATLLRGAIVTLRGYYWKSAKSGFEELVLQDVEDSGLLADPPAPRPIGLELASRGVVTPEAWFHHVVIDILPEDPLQIADMAPPELVHDTCPMSGGFALRRAAGTALAAACDGGVNPPSAERDPDAILLGRAFFHDFSWSTDCACAAAHHQHLLASDATFVGELRGILSFSVPLGSTTGWQILEPLANADVPALPRTSRASASYAHQAADCFTRHEPEHSRRAQGASGVAGRGDGDDGAR